MREKIVYFLVTISIALPSIAQRDDKINIPKLKSLAKKMFPVVSKREMDKLKKDYKDECEEGASDMMQMRFCDSLLADMKMKEVTNLVYQSVLKTLDSSLVGDNAFLDDTTLLSLMEDYKLGIDSWRTYVVNLCGVWGTISSPGTSMSGGISSFCIIEKSDVLKKNIKKSLDDIGVELNK